MRIGLLADTHITNPAEAHFPEVAEAFRGVDLILHAGDIYIVPVLDELQRIAPVLAARGDDDSLDMLLDERVKQEHELKLEGLKLLLIHERPYVYPYISLTRPSTHLTEPDRRNVPDIVVFGHEHYTVVQHDHDVLFINPGSPTFLHYHRGRGTVAILDLDSGKAETRIVYL